MKISANKLISVLKLLSPGTGKTIQEETSHYTFFPGNVATFNDVICIVHPLEEANESFSVRSNEFYNVISKIPLDNPIEISLDGEKISIKSKGLKANLSVSKNGLIEKVVANFSFAKWDKLPTDFVKGIELCKFSVSKDSTSGALFCLFVNKKNIVSSDNFRISKYSMDSSMPSCLLPLGGIQYLKLYPVVEYCPQDNWIHFKTEAGIVFSCRTLLGDFPGDVDQFLEPDGEEIILPKEFMDLIDGVLGMTPDVSELEKRITIIFDKEKVIVKAQKDIGWIERWVEYSSPKEMSFDINPIFLQQILEKDKKITVGDQRAWFISDSFKHVLLLP